MLRILLIDDSYNDRLLAIHALEQELCELKIQEITQAQELNEALTTGQFDLVITDYQLRWNDGLTVLRTIKSRYPDRPVVMFTNSGTQEIAVEAMKSGLDDYVIKSPNHYVRLPAAVRRAWEQAQAQRKAAGVERRLQTLLNNLNVGVYRCTVDGTLIDGNPAFLRLLGINSLTEILENQTLEPYFQPQDYTELLGQLKANGIIRDREIQVQRADGTIIWVRLSKTFTKFADTTIVDGLMEDISDRKRAEEELKQSEQQLKVALARDRSARIEAQAANKIKDEFLAIVSHELRTPLNSMLGWAQLLRKQQLDTANTVKALETIERNARLQNKLINDILDVSRIIQNRITLDMRPVHLVTVVNAVIEDIQPLAKAKFISIESILDPAVGQVMGDSERLQQIVWNLLSNAIKFTPQGGRVQVWLEQVNTQAQLTVSDTGQGISADFLPHVFDRFRQADSTITRKYGGLGLGLAIAHHLLAMHKGTIHAASDGVGQGATFTVQLPIDKPQSMQLTPSKLGQANEFPSLNGLQILVVDDDEDTREMLKFILEQCEAQVNTAASAAEALQIFAQLAPDVLLCDIGMPDEDGYSLIRKVRQLPGNIKHLPAIALTAFAREDDQHKALQAGFQRHLAKPINPFELAAVVASFSNE
ncbi:MAG: response regulator [Desmonostoc vinosum HA7617-LM4]|jgi:PAS domain S-box-containing protein|nr:response regulator [Desmonostoc vinosum HA7617-LM4]